MAENTKQKKKRDPQFTSPIGTFRYPHLQEPSYGSKEFPTPDGVYGLDLLLPQSEKATQDFIALLTPLHQEALALGDQAFAELPRASRDKLKQPVVHPLFNIDYDKETEEPTGNVVFKFKLKASGIYKSGVNQGKAWTAEPQIYDASGRRLFPRPAIWGGSTGRVSFSAAPFFMNATALTGISTRMIGVQLFTLVAKGERSAESLGFGVLDDGYVTQDMTQAEKIADTAVDTIDF